MYSYTSSNQWSDKQYVYLERIVLFCLSFLFSFPSSSSPPFFLLCISLYSFIHVITFFTDLLNQIQSNRISKQHFISGLYSYINFFLVLRAQLRPPPQPVTWVMLLTPRDSPQISLSISSFYFGLAWKKLQCRTYYTEKLSPILDRIIALCLNSFIVIVI